MHIDSGLNMFLYSWLRWQLDNTKTNPLLPKPDKPKTSTASINDQEEAEMTEQDHQHKQRRYYHYTTEVSAKMSKYASAHGNKAAATTCIKLRGPQLATVYGEDHFW